MTASEDQTARVWNVETGETIAVLRHGARMSRAVFDASGLRVLTWPGYGFDVQGRDNTARIWTLQPDTQGLIDHARALLEGQALTPAQRKRFLLED